ncbi:MAG: NAD(P)-dependent alcohol dehydrogenase [Candidatus Eiseniibacteriota bacterium]
MKAVVCDRYGPPDVLEVQDVDAPVPLDSEVLVRVRAASVNPLDAYLALGKPYLFRFMGGAGKSGRRRPGVDLAGRVEAIGKNVSRFRPGDEVFGVGAGAYAELVCANESNLASKPAHLSFEQAAAVPVAGLTALQGLRDSGRIRVGQDVLVNGASGGVGTFAVQVAKAYRTTVTGVCSTGNVDLVRSIGADHVVDYTKENFAKTEKRYDLLFDCVAERSLGARLKIVKPDGMYVVVGPGKPGGPWIGPLARVLKAALLSSTRKNMCMFLSKANREDFLVLKELMETKKVTPVIDRCYPLEQAAEAFRYFLQGHARGKVVLTIE